MADYVQTHWGTTPASKIVRTDTTIQAMIYSRCEQDVELLSYLPAGVNGILPRLGIAPEAVERPFVWIRLEQVSQVDGQAAQAIWIFEIHQRPGTMNLRTDKILIRLRELFDHSFWEPTINDKERPIAASFTARTGLHPDRVFQTVKALGRMTLEQI